MAVATVAAAEVEADGGTRHVVGSVVINRTLIINRAVRIHHDRLGIDDRARAAVDLQCKPAAFLAPRDMPEAMRDWCRQTNQEIPDTDGGLIRCALESLALKYRMVLGWLEELSGQKTEVIHIVGGGTQNELLNQFTANATGRPVITGPVEATALGNVLVQARTAGSVGSLAQIRDVVRASSTMQRYEPQNTGQWNEAYGRFVELQKRPNV